MNRLPNQTLQTGLSLVEFMVAIAIQVILLAGMVYVYGSSRTLFTVNQELSRVQENGRYATDMLLYDIRMAGFAGCRNIGDIEPNIIANSPPVFSALTDSLTVFENGAGWTNPTAIARVAGTDVITLQSTQGVGMQLTGNMAADNANIQVARKLVTPVSSGSWACLAESRAPSSTTCSSGPCVTWCMKPSRSGPSFLNAAVRFVKR